MGPAYLRKPVSEGPIRTDIMTGSIELPTEELRKQYRHLSFCQSSSLDDRQTITQLARSEPDEQQVPTNQRTFRQTTCREETRDEYELDTIASATNSWSVKLSKTRMLTRWLELSRAQSLTLAYDQDMISKLYLENSLADLANNLALKAWLKHAGKDKLNLVNKGNMKNMVVVIGTRSQRYSQGLK